MVTEVGFTLLVAAIAIQRLLEVGLSRRNQARLEARGGREHAAGQLRWMKLLHGGWLVAMLVEVWAFGRPLHWGLAIPALLVLGAGQTLRYLAISALGQRWTVSIVTVPGERVVTGGVFRHIRHPNYLGVALEIAALPLIHGAWVTALVFSVANGLLLSARIRAEERALAQDSDYTRAFGPGARPARTPG
jgi:methyltransferase